jgi:signal transduction histidine kinase
MPNRFSVFQTAAGNAYPGTGIGLAICERIVKAMGADLGGIFPGRITFFFTLPDRLNHTA